MSSLWHYLRELGDGPFAWSLRLTGLALIAWAALRVAALLLQWVVPLKGRWGARFTRGGLGLLLANTTAFIAFESVVRAEHLRVVFDHGALDPSQKARAIAEATSAQFIGVAFWAVGSLLGLFAYAAARWSQRSTHPVRPWEVLGLALWSVVALSSLQQIDAFMANVGHEEHLDSHGKDRLLEDVLASGLVPMERGIWLLGATCFVGAGLWLWRSRKKVALAPSSLRVPLLVFGFGLISFLLTRAHHADARQTVRPRLAPPYTCAYWMPPELPVSQGVANAAFVDGPLVLIESATRSRIDGIAADQEGLAAVLRAKRELWHQLKPHAALLEHLVVAAAPRLSMSDVSGWLQVAAASGYSEFHALLSSPRESLDSRTLGHVQREPTCSTVQVPAQFRAGATWGEHVAGAEK